MRVLLINSVCGIKSTGRICTDIAMELEKQGHEVKIAYGRENVPSEYQDISYRIGSELDVKINALKARIFDNEGFNAKKATITFLKWADEYNPDLVWLHNLHGYYINVEMLFNWIKSRPQMKVKWTLHDCWAFTGHCAHFSYVKCEKWRSDCNSCCQKKTYPTSIVLDRSKDNYQQKKQMFTGVRDMLVITPSKWLADLVRESFLKEYPVQVEYNKIDRTIFKPTPSNFRKKYGLENKKIVLGVATAWTEKKGLYDFVKLAEQLDDSCVIVLVGLTKKQVRKMPPKLLCLPRTNNIEELAKIYTVSDVFVNLSYEETFGLTTIEAISCGTPAIVYKGTACEEIANSSGGIAVEQSMGKVLDAIYSIVGVEL